MSNQALVVNKKFKMIPTYSNSINSVRNMKINFAVVNVSFWKVTVILNKHNNLKSSKYHPHMDFGNYREPLTY